MPVFALSMLALLAALEAPPARAPTPFNVTASWQRMQDGNGRTNPCMCSLRGNLVPLGSAACLQTPDGVRIARCILAGNVTSWEATDTPCATSFFRHLSGPKS